jgi:hypothetical protein
MAEKDGKPGKARKAKEQEEQPYRRSDFLRDLRKVGRRLARDRDERSPRES